MLSRFVFGFFGALLTFTQVSLSSTTPEIEEDRSVLQVVPYTFFSSSRGLSPVTKTDTPPFAILVRSRRTPLTIVAGDSLTVLISPSTLAVDRGGYIRWCRELAPHMLWLAQFVFRGYNNDRAIIAYHQAAQWGEPNVQGEALMGLHQLLEDRKKKRDLRRAPRSQTLG